jgi:hypothetical protein
VADGLIADECSSMQSTWQTNDDDWQRMCHSSGREFGRHEWDRCTEMHQYSSEMLQWGLLTDRRKMLLTLGLSETSISTAMRTKLVSTCCPLWASVEYLWTVVNMV